MGVTIEYYIGLVREVKEERIIKVDIPGVINDIIAYPKRGELDEPKINDKVLLANLDPNYFSYLVYEKIKEDDFIGFRSDGKLLSITKENLTIGAFDRNADYKEDEIPICMSKLTFDDSGNIELEAEENIDLYADKISFNGGVNGGLVNARYLKLILNAILSDLQVAKTGNILSTLMNSPNFDELFEDKTVKH